MTMSTLARGPAGTVEVVYSERLVASLTYDVVVTLAPDRAHTERVFVNFEQGVTIVGFDASVRPAEYGSFTTNPLPTLDDVLVDWDLFQRNHLTSAETYEPSVGNTLPKRMVTTLKSLANPDRLVMKALPAQGNTPPQTGFTFYNRYPLSPASGALPAAINIRLSVYAEPLKKQEGQ